MKEIVKKGTDKYETRCGECGCVFTYTREDVIRSFLGSDFVVCPHCGRDVLHFKATAAWQGCR